MKKNLSPAFCIMVILVAVALGALYFMSRYRAHEAQWAAEAAALQAQRDAAIASGRGRIGGGSGPQMRRGQSMAPEGETGQAPGAPAEEPAETE